MTQSLLMILVAVFFASSVIFCVGWYFQWNRRRNESQELARARVATEMELQIKNEEISQLKSQVSKLDVEIAVAKSEINHQMELRTQAEQDWQQRLQSEFKTFANETVLHQAHQLKEWASNNLKREAELAKKDLDSKQENFREMLKPVTELMSQYQSATQALESQRQKSMGYFESELKKLNEVSMNLLKETTDLKQALKKPHVRGRWGEIQLKNCVELAGMSEYADVQFQDVHEHDDGRLIPDLVVRMPGGRRVIVDAKTPLDAFISALEATTDEQKKLELLRHGRQVKDHIKKLSAKAYSDGIKDSADFTVLFLPNESFLYAALEGDPGLVEFALEKRILIATPPTFVGLLKVIRFGWNEQRMTDNANLIAETGAELHKRLSEFFEGLVDIGTHIDKAKAEYDLSINRLKKRVLPQAYRLEEYGSKSKKEIPVEFSQLTDSTN